MIVLVVGANGSGKSSWAEQMAVRLAQGRLVYIATMIPHGMEGEQRVERHRLQRRDCGFTTMELPLDLSRAELLPNDTVLLEDASNLVANTLFMRDSLTGAPTILAEIMELGEHCGHLIIVSIDGLMPDEAYDEATNNYIKVLQQVNDGLFNLADTVFEMAAGRPLLRKEAGL